MSKDLHSLVFIPNRLPVRYYFFSILSMTMMKKQQFNFVVLLCSIMIKVTAGFEELFDWESGLDEEMYNLQSEPIYYNYHLAGLCSLVMLRFCSITFL